ncbi:MAG: hypothetical protein CUN56_09075 [Phototrophicales bacterium]|nr:MAG: hypothetical protein CUN56_09075 [Phototrophicales bacterium]
MRLLFSLLMLAGILMGCSLSADNEPRIVYITATPQSALLPTTPPPTAIPRVDLSPVPAVQTFFPSPNPPRFETATDAIDTHTVRAGDTLYGIAQLYGTTLDSILALNSLENPNVLEIGQQIKLPAIPTESTPAFKIIPDGRFVRGPGSDEFDVFAFINQQPGYIRFVTDTVETRQQDGSILEQTLTGAQIINQVALEYSIDPRLLLALLEYRAGWLSNPNPPGTLKTHPFISPFESSNRDGLYKQLTWAANQLNFGYYGWKYRGWTVLELNDGTRLLYHAGLNAGTVALQYFLSINQTYPQWLPQIADVNGFYSVYYAYFGDPYANVVDPIVPSDLQQPPLTLPFSPGQTWFFTGGAHGGWGSGSAWAAIDFAPPDERTDGVFCFISNFWVTAVAPGVIARSQNGAVVLDLDYDGDESTGWVIFYLHIAMQDRVAVGTRVNTGDPIGRASCEGGFSTATHLHIARKYNGEWIPADCFVCPSHDTRPVFDLGGWKVVGINNQEYQGYLEFNGERRTAEQGRVSLVNRISW